MWGEPEGMRGLPWARRVRLLLGGEPGTKGETAVMEEYVDWLSGPRLLLKPAASGLGFLLGFLVVTREPVSAVGWAIAIFVGSVGLMVLVRQQALKHLDARPGRRSVQQAVTAGLTTLSVAVVLLGTTWMTHRVTVLVTGDDLLGVVSDVDEQWWGRVDTIVVSTAEEVPIALERQTPDILLVAGATDPVADGIGSGFVLGHREDDSTTVVTLHLTNADEPTWDLVEELHGMAGTEAFRRAGFVPGGAASP